MRSLLLGMSFPFQQCLLAPRVLGRCLFFGEGLNLPAFEVKLFHSRWITWTYKRFTNDYYNYYYYYYYSYYYLDRSMLLLCCSKVRGLYDGIMGKYDVLPAVVVGALGSLDAASDFRACFSRFECCFASCSTISSSLSRCSCSY